MKIGLFGGSFNPIHNSHVKIIKLILKNKLVDEIWILPCKKHPFHKYLASEKDRIKMIKLAIKGIKRVKICDVELKSKGTSYTINTIKKLKRRYKHNFILIIGTDVLKNLKKWHKYKILIKEAQFIIVKRKNCNFFHPVEINLLKKINFADSGISSTKIRDNIKNEKPINNLVDKKVAEYIKNKRLYKIYN